MCLFTSSRVMRFSSSPPSPPSPLFVSHFTRSSRNGIILRTHSHTLSNTHTSFLNLKACFFLLLLSRLFFFLYIYEFRTAVIIDQRVGLAWYWLWHSTYIPETRGRRLRTHRLNHIRYHSGSEVPSLVAETGNQRKPR